jgi:hypothetical protein
MQVMMKDSHRRRKCKRSHRQVRATFATVESLLNWGVLLEWWISYTLYSGSGEEQKNILLCNIPSKTQLILTGSPYYVM